MVLQLLFCQVVKAWQDSATTSGEVAVSGLSPGNHYFVCSIGNHCERGMRVNVTVTTNDQQEGNNEVEVICYIIRTCVIKDYK